MNQESDQDQIKEARDQERAENALLAHLDFISEISLLSEEEEKELTTYYADESNPDHKRAEVREKIAEANLRLVVSIAKQYSNHNVPLADLISEGNIGLLIAIERFKPELGYKLSTYATWWIKQRVLRYLTKNNNLIRVPEHVFENVNKIRKAREKLRKKTGEEPEVEDIAEEVDLSEEKVEQYSNSIPYVMSLDAGFEHSDGDEMDDDDRDMQERIGGEDYAPTNELTGLQIKQFFNLLTDKERLIVAKRYGLTEEGEESFETPMTLKELGNMYGMSREQVRQIEKRALRKMRRFVNENRGENSKLEPASAS